MVPRFRRIAAFVLASRGSYKRCWLKSDGSPTKQMIAILQSGASACHKGKVPVLRDRDDEPVPDAPVGAPDARELPLVHHRIQSH